MYEFSRLKMGRKKYQLFIYNVCLACPTFYWTLCVMLSKNHCFRMKEDLYWGSTEKSHRLKLDFPCHPQVGANFIHFSEFKLRKNKWFRNLILPVNAESLNELQDLALYLTKLLRQNYITTLLLPSNVKKTLDAQYKQYDELGIPFTIYLNENTLKDGIAWLRSRDSTLKVSMFFLRISYIYFFTLFFRSKYMWLSWSST